LSIRYALAVNSRDIESWLALFVPNVQVGPQETGREALRDFITPRLRWFYRSIHQIVGHRVELLGVDTAWGQVYCRAEHEVGERWVVMVQVLVAAAPSRASTTSVDRYAQSSDGHLQAKHCGWLPTSGIFHYIYDKR